MYLSFRNCQDHGSFWSRIIPPPNCFVGRFILILSLIHLAKNLDESGKLKDVRSSSSDSITENESTSVHTGCVPGSSVLSYVSPESQFCLPQKEKAIDEVPTVNPDFERLENQLLEKIRRLKSEYERGKPRGAPEDQQSVVCQLYLDLVKNDLAPFSNGITKGAVETARNRGVIYQIRNGKIYRQPSCLFPARCGGVEHFLRKVAPHLPDMEFIVNVSDWPQVLSGTSTPLPVLSFSKNLNYADITYPAWTFWEGGPAIGLYPKGIGRWDLMRKVLIATAAKTPWKEKKPLGFFRGSRTSGQRDPLILFSRKHPELVDAQYTKNQAWKSEADTLYLAPAPEVTMEEHCSYKYLFNFRGVAASFRFKHLFLCRSLVIHSGNDWMEFFYPALKPWVHYVPMNDSVGETDIRFLLWFLHKHDDDISQKIADRGYKFIKKYLRMEHVDCYWKELLTSYGKLIRYHVGPREDLVPIF